MSKSAVTRKNTRNKLELDRQIALDLSASFLSISFDQSNVAIFSSSLLKIERYVSCKS
jgi:hypothetical protein